MRVPPRIEPGQNPDGLISVVYEGDGTIFRFTPLSTEDEAIEDKAAVDAACMTGQRTVGLYDGDSGYIIAALHVEEDHA